MALSSIWRFVITTFCCFTVLAVKPPLYLEADSSGKGSELPFHTVCERDCSSAPKAHYCASNGRTFDSYCRVRQAKCSDPYLTVTEGECKNSTRCRKERSHILKVHSLLNYTQAANVPSCNADGSYAPTQCSVFLGYCWCVTSTGGLKRSSTFKIGTTTHSCHGTTSSRGRRKCSSVADKAAFAIRLRELVAHDGRRRFSSMSEEKRQRDAVSRKHAAMDRDHDGSLSSREMRKMLKRYRKKIPKQTRSCSKIFWKYCDFDENGLVSAVEWLLCLGFQQNRRSSKLNNLDPPAQHVAESVTKQNVTRANDRVNETWDPDQSQSTSPSSSHRTCKEERIELMKGHKKNVNIPECIGPKEEFYNQVQCHGKYCYCVVRETGVPVLSTSVTRSEGMPNCERAESPDVPHPIAGCPSRLKGKFLRNVRKLIVGEMYNTEHGDEGDVNQSLKERAARWYFSYADKNGDGVLGRKENKGFKKFLNSDEKLSRKCLKKFTSHCDRNKDSKTTIDEFIGCLEVRRQEHPRLPPYPDLKGSINQLKTTEDPDNL